MAVCRISDGLACPSCEDLQSKAGLIKEIYLGNKADLDIDTPFDYNSDGSINDINFFTPYGLLYKWCFKKNSANATHELVLSDSGYKFYTQTITGKLQQQNQSAKNAIDDLKGPDDLFAVVLKSDGTFEVYGVEAGIEVTALTKATGAIATDDNTYIITLSNPNGGEEKLAPQFLFNNYAQSLTRLESYVA